MPKPGTARSCHIPPATILRGGSDLAFSLADEAVADEAIADAEASGTPELAAGSADARQNIPGITTRRTMAPGIAPRRITAPGVSTQRG